MAATNGCGNLVPPVFDLCTVRPLRFDINMLQKDIYIYIYICIYLPRMYAIYLLLLRGSIKEEIFGPDSNNFPEDCCNL